MLSKLCVQRYIRDGYVFLLFLVSDRLSIVDPHGFDTDSNLVVFILCIEEIHQEISLHYQ